MSVKRILANEIDSNLGYEVIGLDLAKQNVSFVGITTDGEYSYWSRWLQRTFGKSNRNDTDNVRHGAPCTEMNWLCNELKQRGHMCKVFFRSGCSGSNSGFFLWTEKRFEWCGGYYISCERRPISFYPTKTREEMILQSLCADRELHLKHSKAILVSLKGQAQAWGLKIVKALSSEAKLLDLWKFTLNGTVLVTP